MTTETEVARSTASNLSRDEQRVEEAGCRFERKQTRGGDAVPAVAVGAEPSLQGGCALGIDLTQECRAVARECFLHAGEDGELVALHVDLHERGLEAESLDLAVDSRRLDRESLGFGEPSLLERCPGR